MEPEDPRALGDLEDGEPERRTPAPKKSLALFLEEFEARLRDHPGQAATSATAALEGRAEGVWRTPVEGSERTRRLPRRVGWRPAISPASPAPPPAAEPSPPTMVESAPAGPTELASPAPLEPTVAAPANPGGAEPKDVPPAGKLRRRHRRHHRHR